MAELRRLADDAKEVTFLITERLIQAETPEITVTSKVVDGNFPDYEKVIPVDADKHVMVDCKSFKEALIRVSILSNDRFRGVRLNFEENEIKVSANNPEKEEATDDIKAEYSGEPIEVGFNVNYLIDVLNVIIGRLLVFVKPKKGIL